MKILVDSNVIIGSFDHSRVDHVDCVRALRTLLLRNEELCICAQVLIEFWAVATRPATSRGGLGVSVKAVASEVDQLVQDYTLIEEPIGIALEWRNLAEQHTVIGASVHDLRLVALMVKSGVSTILTTDTAFTRYPQITVIHPSQV